MNFTAETELGWQYISAQAKTQRAENKGKVVTDVIFYVMYYKNVNFQYFDSMQLQFDETGTTYSYDSNGDLLGSVDGANRAESYEKSATDQGKDGPITKYTDIENVVHEYSYDSTYKYRIATAQNNTYNQKTTYEYDSFGNSTKVTKGGTETGAKKQITSSSYDTVNGQLTSTTDTLGNTENYVYDGNKGTLTSATDENANKTSYTYNTANDELTGVSKNFKKINGTTNHTAQVTYEYENDQLSKINAGGVQYSFKYDLFGNAISTSVGTRELISNTYEINNGNLTKSTYGNGDYVDNTYDNIDRMISQTWNGVDAYSWVYNKEGNIYKHVDKLNDVTYNYSYDISGRLLNTKQSDGFSIKTAYDNISKVTSLEYKLGTTSKKSTYDYYAGGIAKKSTLSGGTTKDFVLDDLNDRLSTTKLKSPSASTTFDTSYEYVDRADGTGTSNIIKSITQGVGTSTEKWSYTYDKIGNITKITNGNDSTKYYEFTYDELGQLTQSIDKVSGTPRAERYIYDTHGNIQEKQTVDANNPSTVISSISYTYGDSNWGDLLTSFNGTAITYDTIGNPLSIGTRTFDWEQGRQLKSFTNGGTTANYKYNEGGIRTSKTVGGVTTNYYLNDEDSIVAEKIGNDIQWYHYDSGETRVSIEYKGNTYYYVYNLQDDVIAILDSNYNKVVEYTYDSWGKQLTCTGSLASTLGKDNPFRYRSYYYDNESGYYYLNSRYYDSNMGRFINADDEDVLSDDQDNLIEDNLFAYCLNNPVNMTDSDGDIAWWIAAAAGGAIFDTALYLIGSAVSGKKVTWSGVGKAALKGAISGVAFGAVGKGLKAARGVMKARKIAKAGKIGKVAYKTKKTTKAAKVAKKIKSATKSIKVSKYRCFVAGTLIKSEKGYKPIEEIKIGEMVYSEDPETGKKGLKRVTDVYINETTILIKIIANHTVLKSTPEHPFWIVNKGWVEAEHIVFGDKLKLINGETLIVDKVEKTFSNIPIKVYNFTVEDWHTYYAGKLGVLTHNLNCYDTAQTVISKSRRGSIRSVFPSQYLDVTIEQIKIDKKKGIKAARTAWKLLNDNRFIK